MIARYGHVLRLVAVFLSCCVGVGVAAGLAWTWLSMAIDRAFAGIDL